MRIQAKIEKKREIYEVFDHDESAKTSLAKHGQAAFRDLRGWLNEWRGRCIVCQFRQELTRYYLENPASKFGLWTNKNPRRPIEMLLIQK
jgi:hypothetical protein